MTLDQAIVQANSIGSALSNTTITSACDVLSEGTSTTLQKQTACDTLVNEHNSSVIDNTDYSWPFYNAVSEIHDTVNPNGPIPDRPM